MPLNRLQQATHPQQKNGASNNSSYAGAWEGIYDPWDYDPNQGWTGEPGWTPGSGTGTGPNPPPPGPDPTPDPGEGGYDSDEIVAVEVLAEIIPIQAHGGGRRTQRCTI